MLHALEVHDLWKSFVVGVRGCSVRVSVLRGVSFKVEVGERVAIVGARGAGKTTLLHCVVGLRRPDGGTVRPHPLEPDHIILLDEGMRVPPGSGAAAMLCVARDVTRLRGSVDRVLMLRDGRVEGLEPRVDTPASARRVAESAPLQ